MPRAGSRKVQRYRLAFKRKAVKLSQLKGVEVQAAADALEIHPSLLSGWRKEARDGVLRGRVSVPSAVKKIPPAREMKRFQALQRARGAPGGARRPTPSRSSTGNGRGSA